MNFSLIVTGPAYGTQQSSSAWKFAEALLITGHKLKSVFFYQEGIYNANQFTSLSSDEVDMVRTWKLMSTQYSVKLHVCVTAALRRGVINTTESERLNFSGANLENGFLFSGISTMIKSSLLCERTMQF